MRNRITLISLILIQLISLSATAQYKTTIPLSNKVKHGTLSNGMNYYIMHNEEPKERMSLYFVQNVGAILEKDSQNGLAHFLEHMAFNGLEHFPGKNMLNYLEKNGIQFGREINAYTLPDQTVYNISAVPTANENLMDSALLVLHDWSGGLLLEDEEIDNERGVIREEWRTRRNSRFRLLNQSRPYLYNFSKYAERDVIGSLDVINNFKYDELRNYYAKWYRPGLQAVVVVGDIDVDKVEKKVKDLFSTIPAKENPAERVYYTIDDSKEMQYVLAKDNEAQNVSIGWIFRKDPVEIKDIAYLRTQMIQNMFRSMLNNRLNELVRKPDCPAINMGVGFFSLARTKDAAYLSVTPKEDLEQEAFSLIITELERVRRYGFTASELKRTQSSFFRSYESYYEDRDKITNDTWAKQLGDYFLEASPLPSIDWELAFAKKTIPSISLDEIHQQLSSFQDLNNSILSISGPDKEEINYPSKEELMTVVTKVMQSDIEAYEDDADDSPLVSEELSEKSVVSTKEVAGVDATMYVLENGAKVVLMPTELSKDEILLKAYSLGGLSLVSRENLESGNLATTLARMSGAGNFDAVQLKKKLSGKIAGVSPSLGEFTEGFSGSASPKDFETMLQLLYLQFEHPRFDKESFETQMGMMRNQLIHIKSDNSQALQDTISQVSSNYHPRQLMFNEDFVNNIDYDKEVEVYKDRFQDASDFTFILVGNVDIERDLPLIQKYIGNLNASERTETWMDHQMKPAKGSVSRSFEREMEVPKSTVYYSIYKDAAYNLKTRIYTRVLADLLNKRYMETIREEEGGSYGVSVQPSISKRAYEHITLSISFDCDPEKQAKLFEIVKTEINNLVKNGIEVDDLNEIKENFMKRRAEAEDQNSFWLSVIEGSLINKEPIANTEEYNQIIKDIDAKSIQKFAKRVFKKYDSVEVIMKPETEPAE